MIIKTQKEKKETEIKRMGNKKRCGMINTVSEVQYKGEFIDWHVNIVGYGKKNQ